jgi:hypothetical protein
MIGRPYPQDWVGLSGENLKRYILVISQGVDILKTAPSAPPPDSPPSNDPQFEGFGGETTPIQLHMNLRGYTQAMKGLINKQRFFVATADKA